MLLLAARQLLLRLILRSHAERRGVSKGEAATAATLDASRRAFGAPQHEGWERAPVWKCFFFSIFALVTSALAAHAQSFADLAKSSGTPQISGLKIVYLSPLGNPAAATRIRRIRHAPAQEALLRPQLWSARRWRRYESDRARGRGRHATRA